MAKVGDNTQLEDARSALKKAIYDWHGDVVEMKDWGGKKPNAVPPKGYNCDRQSWKVTLKSAADLMTQMGYVMNGIGLGDSDSVLSKPLTESVRLVSAKVSSGREKWARFSVDLEVQ